MEEKVDGAKPKKKATFAETVKKEATKVQHIETRSALLVLPSGLIKETTQKEILIRSF